MSDAQIEHTKDEVAPILATIAAPLYAHYRTSNVQSGDDKPIDEPDQQLMHRAILEAAYLLVIARTHVEKTAKDVLAAMSKENQP